MAIIPYPGEPAKRTRAENGWFFTRRLVLQIMELILPVSGKMHMLYVKCLILQSHYIELTNCDL